MHGFISNPRLLCVWLFQTHIALQSQRKRSHFFQMCPQLTAHVAVGSSVAVLQTSLGLDTGSKTTLIGLVSISTSLVLVSDITSRFIIARNCSNPSNQKQKNIFTKTLANSLVNKFCNTDYHFLHWLWSCWLQKYLGSWPKIATCLVSVVALHP